MAVFIPRAKFEIYDCNCPINFSNLGTPTKPTN